MTYEEIIRELTSGLSGFPILKPEIEDLARKVEKEFAEMDGKPSYIFAKGKIPSPWLKLEILRQTDEEGLFKKLPNEESIKLGAKIAIICYRNLKFYMVADFNFRMVKLFFLFPFTEKEIRKHKKMERMFLLKMRKMQYRFLIQKIYYFSIGVAVGISACYLFQKVRMKK